MPTKFWTTCYQTSSRLFVTPLAHAQARKEARRRARKDNLELRRSGGPDAHVSATAPATATRRPPSPILTHRLRWHIAAHLVGDEVFTFYCKRGQLQAGATLR